MTTPDEFKPGLDFDAVIRLEKELANESDRGSVLVASAMLEEALRELLMTFLVPNASSSDSLFDGNNAPLQTFSAGIDAAFRLGIISDRFCRDLHIIRRIRNDVAHRPAGCDFTDRSIKDRIIALATSHSIFARSPAWVAARGELSVRDQFIESASWMVFFLSAERARIKPLKAHAQEFGYSISLDKAPIEQPAK